MAQTAAVLGSPTHLAARCWDRPLIFDGVRADLCPALERVILDRMHSDRGRRTGSLNIGGWKSSEDFFSWSDEPVQELRRIVAEMLGSESLVAWAMVNRAGSRHPRHQHRVALLTGVYYVTAGNAVAIAPTVFECPCAGRSGDRYELEVEPYPGRVALFRGEMWHWVSPYLGESPRITIAFDVRR